LADLSLDLVAPTYDWANPAAAAKGAGANGQLYNGMVLPFVNMSLKGWNWYQGENNLGFHTGNVLDNAGYACMLPTMIANWRRMWSEGAEGTTNPQAPFGIVMVADSTDEGWGCNVPQMNWAQTANHGVAPNIHLPNTYFAATHDLADPWADGCMQGSKCCVDTGSAPDPACDPRNDGRFLVQTGQYPGSGKPVTPSMGVTIHPRVKRQVGARLAQAAWSLYYNHPEVAHTGPVISGCSLGGSVADAGTAPAGAGGSASAATTLTVTFNATLLGKDRVAVSNYNATEKASVFWVLVDKQVPDDADRNWLYVNRQPWWGDDISVWQNVDIKAGATPNTVVADVSGVKGTITAVKYGHMSPKGSPQSGESKTCCGDRNFATSACAPESCPISLASRPQQR